MVCMRFSVVSCWVFPLLFSLGCHHSRGLNNVEPYAECPTEASTTGRLHQTLDQLYTERDASLTGILMLEEGLNALLLRGWLTEQATERIDIQYFIFSADNVGLLSMSALLGAAQRGVHIRLLVDDVLAHGDEYILRDLHSHPNIDVKVYNPNINIGRTLTEKSKNVLTEFESINQRMHHKAFIVDGSVVVTGGRNVGDEYYDLDDDYNFRDRDVALFGGTVDAVQESFELFWADDHSVGIHSLLPAVSSVEVQETWTQLRNYSCSPENFEPIFRMAMDSMPSVLLDHNTSGKLHWIDSVQYISDAPWKNETEGLGGGSITTRELLGLLDTATNRIWIQTPYLVLSEVGLTALQTAIDKGIEVKILTNSLAATDNYPAFAGYKKVRNTLMDMGVQVYEMKPNAPDVQAMNRTQIPTKMDADVGLHAKSMLIDETISVVGTFNMDPRSANLNTESFVVIRDEAVTQEMAVYFEREMNSQNAWPTSDSVDREAGLKRRILTWLSAIVPSSLL